MPEGDPLSIADNIEQKQVYLTEVPFHEVLLQVSVVYIYPP
jgi:hypothetical protein